MATATATYRASVRAKEPGRRGHAIYSHDCESLFRAAAWLARIERSVTASGGEIIRMTITPGS